MSERKLRLEFDNSNEVFFPGLPISGKVYFETKEKYKARAVNIQFDGKAYNKWTLNESVRRTDSEGKIRYVRHPVHYSATVIYLDHEMLLWSSEHGSNLMPPGNYVWPFSFTIPSTVPPSFEGEFGYIRYSVTAEIDRPWRFDKAKKRCITVSPWLDLNVMPLALNRVHYEESEVIGCGCFKKGIVQLKTDIPKTGFVPGETVSINLHILNHGSTQVTKAKAKIFQDSKFVAFRDGETIHFNGLNGANLAVRSSRETQEASKVLAQIVEEVTIMPNEEHRMILQVLLPSITPTISVNCPIIDVTYRVQVEIDTPATFNSKVVTESFIIVGTIPIKHYIPPAMYPDDPNKDPSLPTPMRTMVEPSAPPMSYEQSTFGAEDTKLDSENNEKPFAPKYPVYTDLPVYNPTAPPE